jgi:hypothetical protein
MKRDEICCVICGEASTALFCEECRELLSPNAPKAKAVGVGATEEDDRWTAGGTSSMTRSSGF